MADEEQSTDKAPKEPTPPPRPPRTINRDVKADRGDKIKKK